jgi:hypothetical protein
MHHDLKQFDIINEVSDRAIALLTEKAKTLWQSVKKAISSGLKKPLN